jgi:hypothetical protein
MGEKRAKKNNIDLGEKRAKIKKSMKQDKQR